MKKILLAVLGLGLAVVLLSPLDGAGQREKAVTSRMTRVKGTRVSLLKPDVFVHAPYGTAFVFPNGGATIQVAEFPKSLADMRARYLAGARADPNVKVVLEEDLEIDGNPGFLMLVDPKAGEGFSQWGLLMGDDEESVLVSATGPNSQRETLDQIYRQILFSAKWNRGARIKPYESLPFVITGKSIFLFATRYGTTLTYTLDGTADRKSPDSPLLVVSVADRRVEPAEQESFCKQAILGTPAMKGIQVVGSGSFEVDGVPACEALAEAVSVVDERPMMLYEANIFEKSRVYSFKGFAGIRFRAQYINEFTRLSRQLRRK